MFVKIEVGEYVRTKIGIGKILGIFEYDDGHKDYYTDNCIDDEDNSTTLHIHQILKHSKNIIDLIKKGDYVNGYKVEDITIFKDGTFEIVFNEYQWITRTTEIETIVTKEQFTSIEYKVEEDK